MYKVESQFCSVKQSLIGLHKEVMSLSTLSIQTRTPITGQSFFSSVQNGVFNLVTSFIDLKEVVKLHEVIDSNKLANRTGSVICASTLIMQIRYSIR